MLTLNKAKNIKLLTYIKTKFDQGVALRMKWLQFEASWSTVSDLRSRTKWKVNKSIHSINYHPKVRVAEVFPRQETC